jgi:hypothetical protein
MTSSEMPGNGDILEIREPVDGSGAHSLAWIEEFIGMDIEAISEIHQVYQDSQSLIENNGLLGRLGLTNLENPIQKQAAEMFKFFLMEDYLKSRLKVAGADIDLEGHVEVVRVALEFVQMVNKEELDLIPDKAGPIKKAVDELFDEIENKANMPPYPKVPIDSVTLAEWAGEHRLITV